MAEGDSSATLNNDIIRQLEYYFGNINLPRDKFLQERMKEDEGWITIDTLLSFNRLAQITKDAAVIADAVKGAESDIISLSEDGNKIRRNIGNPLPENSLEYWQKIKYCTVYMKGFGESTTLDEVMQFARKYGQVENVLMRRTKPDRVFKGSCFITYKTHEEAEVAQKSDDKFGDVVLTKMMQDDYWSLKNKENKEKKSADKVAKQSKNASENVKKEKAKYDTRFAKGLVLSLEGLPENFDFQDMKTFFRKFGNVGFVAHEAGKTTAEIRFSGEENAANEAWEKAKAAGEGKVVFQEKELTAKVLEGEEEEQYWERFNQSKQNMQSRDGGRGRGRGRGGRGGRGRGGFGGRGGHHERKRGTDNDDGAPVSKRTVFADDDDDRVKKEPAAAPAPSSE